MDAWFKDYIMVDYYDNFRINSVRLTQRLVRMSNAQLCLNFVAHVFDELGIEWNRYTFYDVDNLFAVTKAAKTKPCLAFIGHVDVVPAKKSQWRKAPPFSGKIIDDSLYGRGSVDMKGGLACFLSAISALPDLKQNISSKDEFISVLNDIPLCFMITTDEEGWGYYGIRALLQQLQEDQQLPNIAFALLGEPTSRSVIGDHIKIGGRGSLNITLTVLGKAGHVAYASEAINPIHTTLRFLTKLTTYDFDTQAPKKYLQKSLQKRAEIFEQTFQNPIFEPTHVEVTSIDVNNMTTNMIPHEVQTLFNIRFNHHYTASHLLNYLSEPCFMEKEGLYFMEENVGGEPFLSKPSPYLDRLFEICKSHIQKTPLVSAFGANSDARFIGDLFPFAELGLKIQKAHQTDECVSLADLESLTNLYQEFLRCFFKEKKLP